MKKFDFGLSNDLVSLANSELRGTLVQIGTHHTPVIIVGIRDRVRWDETQIRDAEYDSNHRTDCTDDVQAQAAFQLKKTQRVRVKEENYCS